MTAEEIRKIVDDERTEQLTAQVCRHWQVAADRLEVSLVGVNLTCI